MPSDQAAKGPQVTEGPRHKGLLDLAAEGEEAAEVAPVVGDQAQVEAALPAVDAEGRRAAKADGADADRGQRHDGEIPLDLGVSLPEGQKHTDEGRLETEPLELSQHLLGTRVTVEMHEHELVLPDRTAVREELVSDIPALPVVATGLDHLLERTVLTDRHGVHCLGRTASRLLRGRARGDEDLGHFLCQGLVVENGPDIVVRPTLDPKDGRERLRVLVPDFLPAKEVSHDRILEPRPASPLWHRAVGNNEPIVRSGISPDCILPCILAEYREKTAEEPLN